MTHSSVRAPALYAVGSRPSWHDSILGESTILGAVVQLRGIPRCRRGGCEFESRLHRAEGGAKRVPPTKSEKG